MIDDSALFHGRAYDPAKAHEYYMRKRKLKGRIKGGRPEPIKSEHVVRSTGGKPNRSKTKSRQAELKAQKEALKKRLDRLREVLSELVEDAKKRSGGDPNKGKDEKGKAPETQVDKADRNKAQKKAKPETASQKKERAKKAKEEYEKEHPNSLSQDIDILQQQVADIQTKIKDAMADARARRARQNEAGNKDNDRPANSKQSSGSKGR